MSLIQLIVRKAFANVTKIAHCGQMTSLRMISCIITNAPE